MITLDTVFGTSRFSCSLDEAEAAVAAMRGLARFSSTYIDQCCDDSWEVTVMDGCTELAVVRRFSLVQAIIDALDNAETAYAEAANERRVNNP